MKNGLRQFKSMRRLSEPTWLVLLGNQTSMGLPFEIVPPVAAFTPEPLLLKSGLKFILSGDRPP
mgnify:CR=1 FL=1